MPGNRSPDLLGGSPISVSSVIFLTSGLCFPQKRKIHGSAAAATNGIEGSGAQFAKGEAQGRPLRYHTVNVSCVLRIQCCAATDEPDGRLFSCSFETSSSRSSTHPGM